MKSYRDYFSALNDAQRLAVTTIEGPVLVVAGPGTGKTQLLSVRAANIVRQTDTQPGSILCLTFTESAAANMRARLVSLMGAEGNKVAVHTFHSFGTDIINKHPEYFYNGARFNPANELTSYELLRDIFAELPHANPLAKTMNGEFTYLSHAQRAISHLKRAGLTPDELLGILNHNQAFCDTVEPALTTAFAGRFSKKDFPTFEKLHQTMASFTPEPMPVRFAKPLAMLCTTEFADALSQATQSSKTNPLTTWRNKWCEKNASGDIVFKDRARSKKLFALADIYRTYRTKLSGESLFDFDDMVSQVAHTLETTPELRFVLQEQYLYIMVDEFQDTNGAQARLLTALGDNPVHEGRPNILVVGDDDQAIYSFQGAELSNMLDFTSRYRDVAVITLTDNYRSTEAILNHARSIITRGEQRLETSLKNISKDLLAHQTGASTVELHTFISPESEYHWVAEHVRAQIARGTVPSDIAIIGRKHSELMAMLPYLRELDIPIDYERRNNVLENPQINQLITLAEVVVYLGDQRFDLAEELLPELLSYPFWGLKTTDIWHLSLRAYKERRMWLELMLETDDRLKSIAEFLIVTSHQALHEPLDTMLDILMGTQETQAGDDELTEPAAIGAPAPTEDFVSPYRAFYFTYDRLQKNPADYLSLLAGLRALRAALKKYRPGEILTLSSLIDFIEVCEHTHTSIVDTSQQTSALAGVPLLTAHKSKGLEFEHVYILSCQDDVWGRKARRPSGMLSFPPNLPIEPAGASFDDALRLFFVAVTRSKRHLYLTTYAQKADGKAASMAEFLHDDAMPPIEHTSTAQSARHLEPGWQLRHTDLPQVDQAVLLRPLLDSYKLSATHLNNFIDVTRGGPQAFLLQNLLRFPQAMTPPQAFGHAMHAVLQRAHTHLAATGDRRPIEDVLHDFELQLQQARLNERDMTYQLQKGSDVLHAYLSQKYDTFSPDQKAERNFYSQNVQVGNVRLTGAIDLMHVNKDTKTITVIDYKTGKGHSSWFGKTDFDKIKLHKYKQQLMLYKLLIENSRDFAGYTVDRGILEFVEPDANGILHQLELKFNNDELAAFTQLITAVWQKIIGLDLPDTDSFEQNYKGLLEFEKSLTESEKI